MILKSISLYSFLKTTFIIFLQHFHKKSFVIKIYTDFNLNVLLKLFFSLSKKIVFFSPILANNNLPLKIYYENIMIAFLSFFPFFFSSPHTYPYLFFFFPSFLFFSLPLPPNSKTFHRTLFLFLFFLSPFSLSTSSESSSGTLLPWLHSL